MKLPWTPKPRTASLEELREQLANAKATHVDAQTATHSAQVAFDDAGDPSAEKALLAARAAEQSASEHLARAERLAAAAEEKRKAEERTELERQATEIETKLNDGNPESARLAQVMARQLLEFSNTRAESRANLVARQQLRSQLDSIRVQLGAPMRTVYGHEFDVEPLHQPVAEILTETARKLPMDDPRREYLNTLAQLRF